MKLDIKLDHFYKSVIDDATAKSAAILADYKKQLYALYDKRREELLANQALTLKTETSNVAREKNKQLSSEALTIRRTISEKKDALKNTLFEDVSEKLRQFMTTPAYEELLITQITGALSFASGEPITIYLNPSDASKQHALEQRTNTPLTISTMDFIGGTRAVIHERHILIDNSFITKLTEEKEQFQF